LLEVRLRARMTIELEACIAKLAAAFHAEK